MAGRLSYDYSTLTEDQLADIVRRLVAALAPRAIYLFGSRVTGRTHRDSDVDLLILLDDDSWRLADVGRAGYGALVGVPLPVELHFREKGKFDRYSGVPGSFEHEVKRSARELYVAQR